jgi:hypothetical protein
MINLKKRSNLTNNKKPRKIVRLCDCIYIFYIQLISAEQPGGWRKSIISSKRARKKSSVGMRATQQNLSGFAYYASDFWEFYKAKS